MKIRLDIGINVRIPKAVKQKGDEAIWQYLKNYLQENLNPTLRKISKNFSVDYEEDS